MNQISKDMRAYHEPLTADKSSPTHKVKIIVGISMIVVAIAYLGFMAFQSATVYFYTVSELQQLGPSEDGRIVRVNGKLVPGSFSRVEDSILAHFTLSDGANSMPAIHKGLLPDLFFNEHSEIILEGNYKSDGVFESQNVIVKCPSKYVTSS